MNIYWGIVAPFQEIWFFFQISWFQETRKRCSVCQKPISGSYYSGDEGQPICERCHQVYSWIQSLKDWKPNEKMDKYMQVCVCRRPAWNVVFADRERVHAAGRWSANLPQGLWGHWLKSVKTHAHEMFADAEAEVLWMWESNCWRVHKKRQRPRCLYQLLWKNGELICSVVRGVCRPTLYHYYHILLLYILKVWT